MKENLPNIDLNKVTLTQILKSLSDPIRLEGQVQNVGVN